MDARNRNLSALKQLVEKIHVRTLKESATQPEDANIRIFFLSALATYAEQLNKATTFNAVGSTIIDIHYLCHFCNLWLPNSEKGIWKMLCLLSKLARNKTLELASWDNYPIDKT